ncbi:MAG: InlB B-repeat-containing protein [Syntrophomonadaceae bacterium]
MKKNILSKFIMLCLFLIAAANFLHAQGTPNEKSFILVGDTHFDWWEDHDSTWLAAQGDDYRQVTQEYVPNTKNNHDALIDELLTMSKKTELNVQGVLQMGDLMEGLAGRADLALNMARHSVDGLRASEFSVPWLITRGNHDQTGPGQADAYMQVVPPFISNEIGKSVTTKFYTYTVGDVKFISVDCYDTAALMTFLETELTNTTAKFKIIATHMPIVPVSGRLWNVFENDSLKRDQLMNLIAKNNAVVLAGHLHKYSVLRRMTPYGPFIQIAVNSVIRDKSKNTPSAYTTTYGPNLVDLESSFDPSSAYSRRKYLTNESAFVTNFRMADMPGYAVLTLNSTTGMMTLKAYCGLGQKMSEEVLLTSYDLNITKAGNGTVTKTPDAADYLAGTSVSLKAQGDLGWKFQSWSGDLTGSDNPAAIQMDGNKNVTAAFTEVAGQYELRTEVTGNGSLEVSPAGPYYTPGTSVTIKAHPQSGCKLEGWTEGATGKDTVLTVIMNSHLKLKALFSKINTYKLKTGKVDHGTITTTPQGSSFYEFTNVKVTAVPDQGWELLEWTGAVSGKSLSETLYMDGDKEVKALFKKTDGAVMSIKPAQDGYVRGGLMYADKFFGADTTLRVLEGSTDSYRCRSFLKFPLKDVKGTILSAVLKMKVRQESLKGSAPARVDIYPASSDLWDETTLKWKASPSLVMTILDSCTVIDSEITQSSWNVTDQAKTEVKSDTMLTLILRDKSSSNITVDFYSRETAYSPELLVVTDNATSVSEPQNERPRSFTLRQNYPNPFNPSSKISFSVPEAGHVKLKVFNILGNEVASLVNEYKAAGSYTVEFNGSSLPSGVYFYRIESGRYTGTKKLILAK